MFFASYLLRPVCRSLSRQVLSWFALEIRAFALSLIVGTVVALIAEIAISGVHGFEWQDWTVLSVQCTIILFLWCSLYFSIKQWRQSVQERERLLRAEAEARETRLMALRYQLNPHFLFNALNALSTLVLEGDAPAANRMVTQIAELLCTILDAEVPLEVPFSREIAFTQRYLEIEHTRLGERLEVELAIAPETLDAVVPSMLLQPLIENAVRHGVAPLVEGGTVAVRSQLHDTHLKIIIKNSGRELPCNGCFFVRRLDRDRDTQDNA